MNELYFILLLVFATSIEANNGVPIIQETGNKIINGNSLLTDSIITIIQMPSTVEWMIGDPFKPRFVVGTSNGVFIVSKDSNKEEFIEPKSSAYPVVQFIGTGISIKKVVGAPLSASPIPVTEGGYLYLYSLLNGDLVLSHENGTEYHKISINAIPLAIISTDTTGRFAVYTGATPGDPVATGLCIFSIYFDGFGFPSIRVIDNVTLSSGENYDGLYPVWADVNKDGNKDLVTAVHNSEGSKIVVYNFETRLVCQSSIDQRGSWRIPLLVFQHSTKQNFLVVALNPDSNATIEIYQCDDKTQQLLLLKKSLPQYFISAGNTIVETILAGDFDSDGVYEILVLDGQKTKIVALGVDDTPEIKPIWSLTLPIYNVSSNFAVSNTENGLSHLAFGTGSSVVIYSPKEMIGKNNTQNEDNEDTTVLNAVTITLIIFICSICLLSFLKSVGIIDPLLKKLPEDAEIVIPVASDTAEGIENEKEQEQELVSKV